MTFSFVLEIKRPFSVIGIRSRYGLSAYPLTSREGGRDTDLLYPGIGSPQYFVSNVRRRQIAQKFEKV